MFWSQPNPCAKTMAREPEPLTLALCRRDAVTFLASSCASSANGRHSRAGRAVGRPAIPASHRAQERLLPHRRHLPPTWSAQGGRRTWRKTGGKLQGALRALALRALSVVLSALVPAEVIWSVTVARVGFPPGELGPGDGL